MKIQTTILATAFTLFVGAAQAEEIQRSDFSGMVYVNMPFGGSAKATKGGLTFGLAAQREFATGVRANALIPSSAPSKIGDRSIFHLAG